MGGATQFWNESKVVATLAAAAALALAASAADNSPVTDERLVTPEPENGLMYRGT